MVGNIDTYIEKSLTTRLVLAKNLKQNSFVKLSPKGKIFSVWKIIKQDETGVVLKGSFLNENVEMEITTSPTLKVRVFAFIREYHDETSHRLQVQPIGFWTDVITVRKNKPWSITEKGWEESDLTWSSGGTSGQFSSVDTAEYFIEALEYAKNWANKMDEKYN